ncbi:MAG: BLUF domain-containing protein [Sandaracinobacter sp.]
MADLQLIYVSRSFGFDSATLAGILLDARRCNVRDGITGSLICREDLYLQLLEGPEAAVEACFARIGRDDRHLNVRLISRRMVDERLFPHWAMRDDPARSWMWSADDVADGAADRATADEVIAIFERLAREPDEAPSGCPMSRA